MSERRNQAESSIESVNELGGIRIKCRNLTMESGENLGLESAKGMELTSAEEMGIKTKKDAAVTGGKEAAVIGSTVTTCNDVGARDNSTVMAAGKGAHLHVSVYKTGKTKGEDLFTDTYITKYKVNDKWKSDMVNPFDHKIERRF